MADRVKPEKKAPKAGEAKKDTKSARKRPAKKATKKKAGKAAPEKGYKGHRKGSAAEKLRKIFDEKGFEAAQEAAKRMEVRGEIASHTYRSLFSFWRRGITPGSGKRRGRKVPVQRTAPATAKKAGSTRRVKPQSKKAEAAPRRVRPKKEAA